MSKMTTAKVGPLDEKFITKKFNEVASKIDIPATNPIPYKQINVDLKLYTKASFDISTMAHSYQGLLLASLNGQGIEYLVSKREMHLKKGELTTKPIGLIVKFIKQRMAYTLEGK